MQTVTWSRVEDYLESLTGIDDFSTSEKAFLKSAFNRRARMAYEESPYWPGYVHEELRYASLDNVIPWSQSRFEDIDTVFDIQSSTPRNASPTNLRYDWIALSDGYKILNRETVDYTDVQYTATKSTVSGSLVENISSTVSPTANSISFWLKADAITDYGAGGENIRILPINAGGSAASTGDSVGNILLSVESATSTVQARNGWIDSEGTSMQVYIDGVLVGRDFGNGDAGVEIQNYFDGEWHNFVWTMEPSDTNVQNIGQFYYELNSDDDQTHDLSLEIADVRIYAEKTDAATAWSLYNTPSSISRTPIWTSTFPQYWVSYKQTLDVTYGDGSGETSAVPIEFFEYGVHGAYADWLRSEGQTDKAHAEESFARSHLERQLERIHQNNGSPYLWSRFSTHGSRQNRSYSYHT